MTRSARDGRYEPGPGLVALGTARPSASSLCTPSTFSPALGELVELPLRLDELAELFEIALEERLGRGHGGSLLGRLGGYRLGAPDIDEVEGELESGVWMLATSLDDHALLGVVGPTARLRSPAGASARAALRGQAGDGAR